MFRSNCPSCGKEFYYLKNPDRTVVPVDTNSIHTEEIIRMKTGREVMFNPERHKMHLATCTNPKQLKEMVI